jgi:hypothetical protein
LTARDKHQIDTAIQVHDIPENTWVDANASKHDLAQSLTYNRKNDRIDFSVQSVDFDDHHHGHGHGHTHPQTNQINEHPFSIKAATKSSTEDSMDGK